MLEIIEFGKDEYAFPSLIVLGCFDAIHEGHRELFKKAKLQAKINGLDLGVMMFRDGKGGRLLYSFEERVKMLEKYNVKFVLAIDFTPEFKEIAPLDFLSAIEDKINVKAYMSGKDFRFGKGAKGKSSTLKNFAEDEENGVWYMPVKDILYEGEKISTTLVKSCLDSGDVMKANALLGEQFYLDGQVVEGAHRGTQILGFPTVNIVYPEWKYPVRRGVYKVRVTVDGQDYAAIANFGPCPTFDDAREVLEANIKDFSGDLYGKEVRVSFVCFMRGIKKFASPEELAAQLSEDKAALDLSDEEFANRYGQAFMTSTEEETVGSEEQNVPEVAVEAGKEETKTAEQPLSEAEKAEAVQTETVSDEKSEEPVQVEETDNSEAVTKPEEQPAEQPEEQPEEQSENQPAEQPEEACACQDGLDEAAREENACDAASAELCECCAEEVSLTQEICEDEEASEVKEPEKECDNVNLSEDDSSSVQSECAAADGQSEDENISCENTQEQAEAQSSEKENEEADGDTVQPEEQDTQKENND